MSSPSHSSNPAPLDLSSWRMVPTLLMVAGFIGVVLSPFVGGVKEAAFSYLTAYMFFLSFGLGGLILVILHHLFDASWSVPIRRFCEHLASLLPLLAVLFVPIIVNVLWASPENTIYHWIELIKLKEPDHALTSKFPLFTIPAFLIVWAVCGLVWKALTTGLNLGLVSFRGLRAWSLEQDRTGGADCTVAMRRYSASGVFLFALTVTLASIMWMKSLQHEWFSTMYGVYYFAASVWVTMFTVYAIAKLLDRQGYLREVMREKTYYFMGSLMFAFTVFYAYITFFQYFIIWNANIPEETFFYVHREQGAWYWVCMVVIFGHFFAPFLILLRIDVKLLPWLMIPLAIWAWLMHYVDTVFQVMPPLYKEGPHLTWMDFACLAFLGGLLARAFLKALAAHPVFPQKDPRLAEALDLYIPPASLEKTAGAGSKTGGGH